MKHAACILALVVAAFVVGCQDNSITNPITGKSSAERHFSKANSAGTIPLNGVLREPGGFNSFTQITGQVVYTTTLIPRDPIPPNPQWAVLVTLAVDAELRPFGLEDPVWHVSNFSRDELAVSEDDGTMFLEKNYRIEGRNDGVSLHLQFYVTETNVSLVRMWLAQSKVAHSSDGN